MRCPVCGKGWLDPLIINPHEGRCKVCTRNEEEEEFLALDFRKLDAYGNSRLHNLVLEKDEVAIQKAIVVCPDAIGLQGSRGYTPLSLAVLHNLKDQIKKDMIRLCPVACEVEDTYSGDCLRTYGGPECTTNKVPAVYSIRTPVTACVLE